LSYPASYLYFASSTEDEIENKELVNENIPSFSIIHTNWYRRKLKRILKFYPKYFQRVHPDGMVRGSNNYEDVVDVEVIDKCNFIIKYRSISPDFITANENDVKRMLTIFKTNSLIYSS